MTVINISHALDTCWSPWYLQWLPFQETLITHCQKPKRCRIKIKKMLEGIKTLLSKISQLFTFLCLSPSWKVIFIIRKEFYNIPFERINLGIQFLSNLLRVILLRACLQIQTPLRFFSEKPNTNDLKWMLLYLIVI